MKLEADKSDNCYRVSPALRRCLYYVLISVPVLAATAIWVSHIQGQPGFGDHAFSAIIVASAIEFVFLLPLTWKLCVDERGVARWFLGRQDLWKWDDFAGGKIEKRDRCTLYDATRPWWRRKLRLDYLATKDRATLVRRINEHYRLPPPPEVPESITIKYGFWRSTTFDGNGIHHTIRSQPREYLWNDVARVRITRMDRLRRDFESLQVFLPDEVLKLKFVQHQGGRSPTWRGPNAEIVAEFLQQHLPLERCDIDIVGECPKRRDDLEVMLLEQMKQFRELIWCLGISCAVLLAGFVWMAVEEGLLKSALMFAMYGFVVVPVCWSLIRTHRRKVAQLEAWLSSFAGADITFPRS